MKDQEDETFESCEKLPLRQKQAALSSGLNKRAIIVSVGGLSIILLYIIFSAIAPKEMAKDNEARAYVTGRPSEKVSGLPDDYSKIKTPKPTPPPEEEAAVFSGFANEKKKESAEEKFYREYALKRLRRAFDARESDLQFGSLKGLSREFQKGKEPDGQPGAEVGEGTDSGLNPRDEANRQDEKRAFLSDERQDATLLSSRLSSLPSKYTVQAGTIIPGVLLTGLNSDLPGQIAGQVSQNVFDSVSGNYLLLPQGTKIIGEYDSKVAYGQERVLVVWTRLLLPNGNSITLKGMPGVDLSGYSGLSDQVNNHYLKLITGVVLGSLLGASAQVAYGNTRTGNPDFSELALEGFSQNVNKAGQEITQRNLNIQPTLEIRPGFRFNIFVTKDMILEPYGA